ncbi:hypothetical protein GTO89_00905 [Heliobacterium gestii]|uniref:Uncharacterized protein n=1 Tax=Heliomicrobium gestii TaxID=2699 RepID=A0A845L9J2_HELGE|nr:hypothetical protein [Heliomicrobium gestii]MBM7865329.1 hypothetical protein [Heliomicrobium gestii]MZP41590.1 hypothetical protein [Heliomicrobium gestii]
MGYTFEFTWVLRLPVEELPTEPSQSPGDQLLWKRTHGNIILGFTREGGRMYPVGMPVLIVTNREETIGIGRIQRCEIHALPNGKQTTVVEFSITRMFDEQERRVVSEVFKEMYGYLPEGL